MWRSAEELPPLASGVLSQSVNTLTNVQILAILSRKAIFQSSPTHGS